MHTKFYVFDVLSFNFSDNYVDTIIILSFPVVIIIGEKANVCKGNQFTKTVVITVIGIHFIRN